MRRAPPSLRLRLGVVVGGVLALALGLFALLLQAAFAHALTAALDQRLAEDAQLLADRVEPGGPHGSTFEPEPAADFEPGPRAGYFEVWAEDGTVLARSPSLGGGELAAGAAAGAEGARAATLPDGRRGRLYTARLRPHLETGHEEQAPPVRVAVARGTEEVDRPLASLRLLLWGSSLAALAAAALAAGFAIRRGLRPVERLAARLDAIDARRLSARLPVDDLPAELRPAVVKVNELLARLDESFARERRFGADVSHELRTPIAGLRSILEVAASRPRAAAEYREAVADALALAIQMGGLVEKLLLLARLEASEPAPGGREPVPLRALVEETFAPLAAEAVRRRLRFANRVAPEAEVPSDPGLLGIALSNLLANAVEYTAEGGSVDVESDPARGVVLAVADSGPPLPAQALERLFDPFFRLDSARSGGGRHAGIGLSLVRAVANALGLRPEAENRADGSVLFTLRQPPPPPSAADGA